MKVASTLLSLVVVLFGICGCGQQPTTVGGVITCNGSPLANAAVQFIPAGGDGQIGHAFTDADGRYRAKVSPTRLIVTVNAPVPVGKRKAYDLPDSPLVDVMVESLPERFSDRERSELVVSVSEGQHTPADFALERKP